MQFNISLLPKPNFFQSPMENTRFQDLLQLYLDNKATPAEYQELMQLIKEGNYDEALKQDIDSMFAKDIVEDDIDPSKAEEIIKKVVSTKSTKVVTMQPLRWAAAAAILITAASLIWWTTREDKAPIEVIAEQTVKIEPTTYTGKKFVRLPDGSTVLMNENSQLSYSESFGANTREVKFFGEGYFDIKHDPSRPFKVITDKVTTAVLGTAFNIKAYPEEKEVMVTVTRGKVQVSDGLRVFGVITQDQQIAVNTNTYDFVQTNLKAEIATVWKSKYLILDDVSMEAAAAVISDKYNVKITFANEAIRDCPISATFLNGEDLSQILTVITGIVQLEYKTLPDGNIEITGNGCK